MSKYLNKTQPTELSVEDFIRNYPNQKIVDDCLELVQLFKKVTGYEAVLWGTKIGFGKFSYAGKSTAGDWFLTGFAPTKAGITIYTMAGYENLQELLDKLGIYKTTGSCLYIKKLADIDTRVLEALIVAGVKETEVKYPRLD